MIIKERTKLTPQELEAVRALEMTCREHDGLLNEAYLLNDINYDKSLANNYLCYIEDELAAFITAFFPTAECAELTAYTHPSYRERGCFKALLTAATRTLGNGGVKGFQLCVESTSRSGKAIAEKLALKFDRTEYTMDCYPKTAVLTPVSRLTTLSVDGSEETKALSLTMMDAIYGDDPFNAEWADAIITQFHREMYLTLFEGAPIGMFSLSFEEGQAYIYSVAILPDYRGRGFSKELMTIALNRIFERVPRAVLDVDAVNAPAVALYKGCGFKRKFCMEYYDWGAED